MNRALTILLIASLCVMSLSGVPVAAAFFADTTSADVGTVGAGVLDLKLTETGPATRGSTTDETQRDAVHDTFEDLKHDGSPVKNTLRVDNTQSSLDAEQVGLVVTYAENDGSGGRKGNAKNTAQTIRLTRFSYQGTNLLNTAVGDENANGRLDVADLTLGQTKQNLATLSGVQAGGTADLIVELSGDKSLMTKVKKNDGVDITFEIAGSAGSFTDEDTSTSNTIRYTGVTKNYRGGITELNDSAAQVYFEGTNGKTWYYANAYYKINGVGDGGGGYKFLDLADVKPNDGKRRYVAALGGLSPGDTIEYYFAYANGPSETFTYTFKGNGSG